MMRLKFIFLLYLMFGFGSLFANGVEFDAKTKKSLEVAVHKVIEAFRAQDQEAINKLINDKMGVYVVYRFGTMDDLKHVENIDFQANIMSYIPYPDVDKKYNSFRYEKIPSFSCMTETWSSSGLFIDLDNRYAPLVSTALIQNKYNDANHTDSDLDRYKNVDSQSIAVTATDDNFEFFMILIDGEWYLSVLYRVEHCSA